jgi:hypothetical protein
LRDDEVQGLMFQSAFLGESHDGVELFAGAAKPFACGRRAICLREHGNPF